MGVLLVILITVLSLAIGYRLISLVRAPLSVWERLGPGAVIGLALTSWIGFLAAVIGGLNAITIGATVFVLVGLWVALDRVAPAREVYVELRTAIREFDARSAIYYVFWTGLLFWLANAGPFIFLLIAALTTRGLVELRTRRFYFAFLIWFVLPNVVLLAPWPWDNIKILICWSLVSSPFVALVLADGFGRNFFWKAASAVLFLILTVPLTRVTDRVLLRSIERQNAQVGG